MMLTRQTDWDYQFINKVIFFVEEDVFDNYKKFWCMINDKIFNFRS